MVSILYKSIVVVLLIILSAGNSVFSKSYKILVFSKTAGYRHTSAIKTGAALIVDLGKKNNFSVDVTEDADVFTSANLRQYAAIVFLCTTGDVLNEQQQQAFESYIRSGGGFAGVHSATDTEYDWPWYGELVGAYFKNHPRGQQQVDLHVTDQSHVATGHLPKIWKKTDEFYNFKWIGLDLNVLIKADENSYRGGENGSFHPISWYHMYDGGRAFYTALGHDEKSYHDPLFIRHLLGGICYAMEKTDRL